jgi:hypothetical protein
MKRITPAGDDRLAREFLDAALRRDTTVINDRIGSILRQMGSIDDSLASAIAELPSGPVDTLRQIGVNVRQSAEDTTTLLFYELHTKNGWGEVSVLISDEGNQRKVFGFRTDRVPASLEATNEFRRGITHPERLLVLALAAALVLFCLSVAVMAVRTRIRRRWLWALFALVGATQFTLNWTTGTVSYNPFQLVLLSAAFMRLGFVGPWLVTVAFPAGAVATLYRIRKEKETLDTPAMGVAPTETPPLTEEK